MNRFAQIVFSIAVLSVTGCAPSPDSADLFQQPIVPYVRQPGTPPVESQRQPTTASRGGLKTPDGKPAAIQFPPERFTRNTAGIDGSGLCVFTSLFHTGDWQDDALFLRQLEYMRKQRGGGYPSKVDAVLKAAAKQYNLPVPEYVQIEDRDIDVLKLAVKNGYMPCVTYGISPTGRYGGKRINHMVNLVHADDKYIGVLDNNYTGADEIEWMTPDEFKRSYTTNANPRTAIGGVNGWAIVLLTPSPPKPPMNGN